MSNPLVSVIMPAYNAASFVGAAIDSVLAQTYANFELIVVDDGSTDDTAAVVRSYGGRVRYLHQDNARQAAARNTGLGHARGELLAFIDADDLWLPEKLEMQVAAHRVSPDLGLIYCSMREIDLNGAPLREHRPNLRGRVLAEVLLGKSSAGIIPSNSLVPRLVFEEIGPFDVDLPPCEDNDMLWRIASRYPIDFVDDVLVLYRLHAGNSHLDLDRTTRGWKLIYRKALRDREVCRLGRRFRRECLGRLYFMLSGDNARGGRWASACCYGIRALVCWPPVLPRLVMRAAGWTSARMAGAGIGAYPARSYSTRDLHSSDE